VQAFEEGSDRALVRLEEQRTELVAPEPPHRVRLANRLHECPAEGAQKPVAFLVALRVVRHLEVVEVEQDEGERAPVALCPRELAAGEVVEGPMVQEPREGVPPRQLGQAARDLSEVENQALVECLASLALPVPLEHAAQRQELRYDLRLAQTEALALAGVVRCELVRIAACLECGDERRERPELPQAAQARKRGCAAFAERFVDGLDRKIPRRCPQNPDAARVRTGSARMQRFFVPYPVESGRVAVPGPTPVPPVSTGFFHSTEEDLNVSVVSMRELLEAGVHFGHQTRRWNPKMRRFLFTERGGIYIIDLQQTLSLLEQAHAFARNIAERGGSVLFVGTKKQAQDSVAEQAARVGMPYVNHRWLGGLLTNWRTISERLERLHELRRRKDEGQLDLLPPKERIAMEGELEKLEANLGGVAEMKRLPDAVFVVDLKKEQLAIREARRLGLPVIGLVDTNCDPDDADYVIPGNDDAIRSCGLIVKVLADGIAAGKTLVTETEISRTNGRVEDPASAQGVEPRAPEPEEAPTEASPEQEPEPRAEAAPDLPETAAAADDVLGGPPGADVTAKAESEEDNPA
jgi:small subunit ribosomal protein S2